MPSSPLKRLVLPVVVGLALAVTVPGSAGGDGALVEVDGIVLRADGGFQPQTLPRQRFIPISFHGRLGIAAQGGGKPPPLQEAVVEFDHDGKLTIGGLAGCAPEQVAQATVEEARRICAGAIVGTGQVEALISLPGETVRGSSELTIFNGPRLATGPSVVFHARNPVPRAETLVGLAPIEKQRGNFRYRVTIQVPPIAGGSGALSRVEFKVNRRFRVDGMTRSYVSARCSDNVLQTHGRFSFASGTVISGQVEKYCHDR